MLDARRMEVYTAVYDRALHGVCATSAQIITEDSFKELLEQRPVYFFGNGAEKCKTILKSPNAHFLNDVYPLARNMFPLAEKAIATERYEDVAYFEPFYLKEFVTTKPKKEVSNGL